MAEDRPPIKLIGDGDTIEKLTIKEVKVQNRILVNEKEVIVKDQMIQSGIVEINNAKKIQVVFNNPFKQIPKIMLTFIEGFPPSQNPYTTAVTKESFMINFNSAVTTSISWTAIES